MTDSIQTNSDGELWCRNCGHPLSSHSRYTEGCYVRGCWCAGFVIGEKPTRREVLRKYLRLVPKHEA